MSSSIMTTAFMLPLWSAGIAMLLTSAALGQTSLIKASVPNQPADIRTLAIAETIPLSATPALVSLQLRTRCDEKGNIYTVQNTVSGMPLMSAGLSGLAVSKLLPSAKLIIPYPVPTLDQYRGVIRIDFDVSADGKVYSLLEAVDASSKQDSGSFYSFVARHRDEGGLESFVKLSDPPDLHLQPSRFAVFRNGYFMVGGTVEIERDTLRPFVAVFDPFGRFIQYVQGFDPQDRKSTARNQAGLSNNAFMAGGPDGNVYLLNGAAHPHLYAVSPTGDVVRDFDITLPAKGLSVSNMTMAGNQGIFVAFRRIEGISNGPAELEGPSELLTVINTQTGEPGPFYRLPPDADGFRVAACATSSDTFWFVGDTADQQHEQLVRYTAR